MNCSSAIDAAAWRSRWLPSNRPPHFLQAAQEVLRCCPASDSDCQRRCPDCKCRCLVYVRNQKAGSSFLWHRPAHLQPAPAGLERFFPALRCERRRRDFLPYKEALGDPVPIWARGRIPSVLPSWASEDGDLLFTVVREPIATAGAAFCEVDERNQFACASESSCLEPSYSRVGCGGSGATSRFAAFLRGIDAHEPLSEEFFHAYPQGVKVNVPHLSVVVKLERLTHGLALLAARLGTRFNRSATLAPTKEEAHTSHGRRCCPAVDDVLAEPGLARQLCAKYAADFECFGYERPAACTDDVGAAHVARARKNYT